MTADIIPIAFAFTTVALMVYIAVFNQKQLVHVKDLWTRSTMNRSRTSDPKEGPNKHRKWGTWSPESFEQPWPQPYPDWSLETTKPLPYRPFRYGPKYYVTMGIRSMQWESWIELDNEWRSFHQQKLDRVGERGSRLVMVHDRAKDAAQETLELLSKYLTKRYPSLFRYTSEKEEAIELLATGEIYPILNSDAPLKYAALLIQDDLAIMMEGSDGLYYLRAGAICLAGFWRLEDKFGMPLERIHTSGDVPQYKEKLDGSLKRFFQKLKPNGPVERNNYFIQTDHHLPWSSKIGSEDSFGIGWDNAVEDPEIDEIHFRSERQTLRRLPRSGGVLFTIRTYMLPVKEMCKEKWVPGRFASAIRSWGDDVARYKGLRAYQDVQCLEYSQLTVQVLLPFLDQEHQRQIRERIIPPNEVEVEDTAYPFSGK